MLDAKHFENFRIRNFALCEARCLKKHGYFIIDKSKPAEPVTTAKIKLKVKCSCKPSPLFKAKIVKEYGKWAARKFYLWSLVGRSSRARRRLGKIQFLTAQQVKAQIEREIAQCGTRHAVGTVKGSTPPSSPGRHQGAGTGSKGAGAGAAGTTGASAGGQHMITQSFSGADTDKEIQALLEKAMQGSNVEDSRKYMSPEESEAALKKALDDFNKKSQT